MNTKLHINISQGLIEVEGEEKFVREIYNDFKSDIAKQFGKTTVATGKKSGAKSSGELDSAKKTTKRRPKTSGPSCASRVLELKEEKFFDQPRTSKEVKDKLDEKGKIYEGKHVSAALIHLVNNGSLRRTKKDGVWIHTIP